MKLFFLFPLLLALSFCAKWKTEITSKDVQKVLDRIAYLRFMQRLEFEDLNAIQSDEELFVEVCELNRIPPKLLLQELKKSHPKLYKHLGKKYEK